mgnify:CR=1 FL=1
MHLFLEWVQYIKSNDSRTIVHKISAHRSHMTQITGINMNINFNIQTFGLLLVDRLKGLYSSTLPVHEPYIQVYKMSILYICWILSCIIWNSNFHYFRVMPKVRLFFSSTVLKVLKNWSFSRSSFVLSCSLFPMKC